MTAEGGDPAAGVHQHGQAPLVGQREHRPQGGVVEREALCARVQLDAPGPGGQAALGLGQRVVLRVEPAEGHEHRVTGLGLGEHHVVGGRIAVRLVHREHHPAGAGAPEQLQQLGARAVVPVGIVGAQVRVGVERLGARHLLAHALEQWEERGVGEHGG